MYRFEMEKSFYEKNKAKSLEAKQKSIADLLGSKMGGYEMALEREIAWRKFTRLVRESGLSRKEVKDIFWEVFVRKDEVEEILKDNTIHPLMEETCRTLLKCRQEGEYIYLEPVTFTMAGSRAVFEHN